MGHDVEVSREIAASPQVVWEALSDITRMGEWSPETHAAEWLDGVDGPAVGAAFTGHNRNGEFEWSTVATITECDEAERFVFECSVGDYVFATWGYLIEPTAAGCRVTEFADDHRSDDVKAFAAEISGVSEREPHNREGMATTLERLAAAVE